MDLVDELLGAAAPQQQPGTDLLERFGTEVVTVDPIFTGDGGIADSADLQRIESIPRRVAAAAELSTPEAVTWLEQVRAYMTTQLHRPRTEPCACARYGTRCVTELLGVQGMYLYEAQQYGGVAGPIGVGHGKEGIGVLLPMVVRHCKVAVLLMPANLKAEFLQITYPLWWQHFSLPTLAGSEWRVRGRPVLHLVTYHELSRENFATRLKEINPDVIIANEAHNLANPKAARTGRFLRYMAENPSTRFFCHSGTLTRREVQDYAHLLTLSLRNRSPLPLDQNELGEWAEALNPSPFPKPMGELRRMGRPGENARQVFRRRLIETPGVVATSEGALGTSLVLEERPIEEVPREVKEALSYVRTYDERPDGEPLVDPLQKAKCLRELAYGFFYYWYFPRGELESVIAEWLAARRAYAREIREELRTPRDGADSPLLLWKAAQRWHEGYTWQDARGNAHQEPPKSRSGPHPVWQAEHWPRWREVRESVKPETRAEWISDFLVKDAAEWAKGKLPGIVWYEHDTFGRLVAQLSGAPFFGPGEEASSTIIQETGKRSIVASIRAHGTGKNLQKFSRSLVSNLPSDGAAWEQMIGRTHRQGQLADEVTVAIYRYTSELKDALSKARSYAAYIEGTQGTKQKLLYGKYTFPVSEVE